MKNKIIALILLFTIFSGLLSGCTSDNIEADALTEDNLTEESYTPVEVVEVELGSLSNTTSLNGRVVADKDLMIFPTMPGKVKSLSVREGAWVNKGDVLFTLDDEDLRKQILQAELSYNMAKANYDMTLDQVDVANRSLEATKALAEAVLDNARENLENTRKLYEAGAISRSQLDQAELGLKQQENQLEAQLDQAKLGSSDKILEIADFQLKQAELGLKQAKDTLGDFVITAPISGFVSGLTVEAGGIATNSQPAMNIVDLNRVYVNIEVVEGLINKLSKNQEVKVNISAASSEAFQAKIDSITPSPNPRTQLYPVRIYLDNKDNLIKPGMFASVELNLDARDNSLKIPSRAILSLDNENMVYIVENNRAYRRVVELGLDTGLEVEVISGLEAEDIVIINGQNYVEDGGMVKIIGGSK